MVLSSRGESLYEDYPREQIKQTEAGKICLYVPMLQLRDKIR